MKFETVKNTNRFPMGKPLIQAEITEVDDSPRCLELTFEGGEIIRTSVENYSTFTISLPVKPKMKTMYRVNGSLFKASVAQTFEHKSDANTYRERLEKTADVEDIKLEEIQVPEDENFLDGCPF